MKNHAYRVALSCAPLLVLPFMALRPVAAQSVGANALCTNAAGASVPCGSTGTPVSATLLNSVSKAGDTMTGNLSVPTESNSFVVGTGGVVAGEIAVVDTGKATLPSATNTYGGIALTTGSAGASVEILRAGLASCVFDGPSVIGDIAVPSSITLGLCHDSGLTASTSVPLGNAIVGVVQSVASAAGATATVRLHQPGSFGAAPPSALDRLKSKLYQTGLIGLHMDTAQDCASSTGTSIADYSGNGNTGTVTLGSVLTWTPLGTGCQLSWASNTNTTGQYISYPGIGNARTVQVLMSGTPQSVAGGSVAGPIVGYTQVANGIDVFLQNKIYATGPAFTISFPSATTSATLSVSPQLYTFEVGATQAANAVYQNGQLMPWMDSSSGPTVVTPGGGNLLIGGSSSQGFTNRSASSISIGGDIEYSGTIPQAAVLQNLAAVQEYELAVNGVDITNRTPYLTTPQQYNVVMCCSSIVAGFNSNTPPASKMTLPSNYTVTTAAISSSSLVGHRTAQGLTERFWSNPNATGKHLRDRGQHERRWRIDFSAEWGHSNLRRCNVGCRSRLRACTASC